MKWVLIFILISVIMLIAKSVSEQYKDKYDFYYNLKNFLDMFKINVSFKKEKILNFLKHINCKKQFKLFIERYCIYIETGEFNLDNITLLDEQEKDDLFSIVKSLGNLNSENEVELLNNFLTIVNKKMEQALQDKQKLCPLIIKLSLLFSIGLAIILI